MATIISFQSRKAVSRRGVASGHGAPDAGETRGQILLFTGVRYERLDTDPATPGKSGSPTSRRRARRG
jgi:hypothetical protein